MKFWAVGLLLFAGAALGVACEEEGEDLVEITTAEWAVAEDGPRIAVGGEWPLGISTPPRCRVLEGPDRELSRRFIPDFRTSLDDNTFSKRFVPGSPLAGPGLPADYYVRCSVTIDPGKELSDTAPVSGEVPSVPE